MGHLLRKNQNVRRLSLELGPKSYAALENLQVVLETSSQAETIRLALQLLSQVVAEAQDGAKLVIQRKDAPGGELEPARVYAHVTFWRAADSAARTSVGW